MSTFARGEFRSFRATNKIHVGKYEMDILMDDIFQYDGHTIRYGGTEYSVPQLRALEGDWFVPESDQHTTYKSKAAGVKVSHATPEARDRGDEFSMGEASEDEALVSTLDEQKQIRQAAQNGNTDRLAQLRSTRQQRKQDIGISAFDVDSNPDAPPPQNAADVDPDIEAALMEHTQRTYMQARPVHSSGGGHDKISPSDRADVARAERINQQRIAARHAELEARDPRKSREEMGGNRQAEANQGTRRAGKLGKYQVIEDDAGGVPVGRKYAFSAGATVGEGVVEAGEVKSVNVLKSASSHPVQVGRAVASTPTGRETGAQVIADPAHTHEPQALRARQTTQISRKGNVGIDDVRESGATGDVDEAMYGDDLADLLPDAAVAGATRKKVALPPEKTEDEEIALIVEGWNTKRNWQKRVEEAVDFYGDWPEALDAICAKESPKVAEQIRSHLARIEATAKKG